MCRRRYLMNPRLQIKGARGTTPASRCQAPVRFWEIVRIRTIPESCQRPDSAAREIPHTACRSPKSARDWPHFEHRKSCRLQPWRSSQSVANGRWCASFRGSSRKGIGVRWTSPFGGRWACVPAWLTLRRIRVESPRDDLYVGCERSRHRLNVARRLKKQVLLAASGALRLLAK